MKKENKYKPGVTKNVLLFLAGFMWICVGTMLLVFAYSWISSESDKIAYLFIGIGVVAALLIHHFGFLKIVDRNLQRILPMNGKRCMFSFMTWKSGVIIIVMAAMGTILRHSRIPKHYLAVLYIGIGLALILSSVRYMRFLFKELRK